MTVVDNENQLHAASRRKVHRKEPNAPGDSRSRKRSSGLFSSFTNAVQKLFSSIGNGSTSTAHGDSYRDRVNASHYHGQNASHRPVPMKMNRPPSVASLNASKMSEENTSTYCDVELDSINDPTTLNSLDDVNDSELHDQTLTESISSRQQHSHGRCSKKNDDQAILFPSDTSTCTTSVSDETFSSNVNSQKMIKTIMKNKKGYSPSFPKETDTCTTVSGSDDRSACSTDRGIHENTLSSYNSILSELDFIWHERRGSVGGSYYSSPGKKQNK